MTLEHGPRHGSLDRARHHGGAHWTITLRPTSALAAKPCYGVQLLVCTPISNWVLPRRLDRRAVTGQSDLLQPPGPFGTPRPAR
jgi:hypothetical protein